MSNKKIIWDYFKNKGFNDFAVAGLMGNLQAESNFNPINLEGKYERKYGYTDSTYTKAVDDGSYTNFVKDSAGYGLAQWTYWSRKQNLLNFAKKQGKSIGDINMQLDFLYQELQGYSIVINTMKNAKSIKEVSDIVLLRYERPAVQSESALNRRASYGTAIYNEFHKTKPEQEEKEVTIEEIIVAMKSKGFEVKANTANELRFVKVAAAAPPTTTIFNNGDKVKLKDGCTYYNGQSIPSWVRSKTLYYRGKNKNGLIFSTLKSGAVTGTVKEGDLIKV